MDDILADIMKRAKQAIQSEVQTLVYQNWCPNKEVDALGSIRADSINYNECTRFLWTNKIFLGKEWI